MVGLSIPDRERKYGADFPAGVLCRGENDSVFPDKINRIKDE